MAEKKNFSIVSVNMPDFIRGFSDVLFKMEEGKDYEVTDDALFMLGCALSYFADDLRDILEKADRTEIKLFHWEKELEKLRASKTE